MTLIDLFREFSQISTTEGYPQSSRILFYTVLYLWNERRRPDVIELSTEKLYTLAGLPESTFREALKYLTDRHWVKRVKSRKRGITALLMRDRRESAAPPAGFPLSPAQRRATEGKEESPIGDSSIPAPKETRDDIARTSPDVGASSAVGGISEAVRTDSKRAEMDTREFPDYF